jgi:hypothetical protein
MINQILFNRVNHFHFAVKIRTRKELINHFEEQSKDLIGFENRTCLATSNNFILRL